MTVASKIASALLLTTAVAADCANTFKPINDAKLANGWSYRPVATGFTKPRGIQFDKDGGLLVVDAKVGIFHLTLKDDGDTCVTANKTTLLQNKGLTHGIALSEDGKTLYASTPTDVYAWSYDSKAIKLGDSNRTVISNMTNLDQVTRTLTMSSKKPGTLLVSQGSASDEDQNSLDKQSGHSQIRSFDLTKQTDSAYSFTDGDLIGWGLRNSVGVAEHPTTGGIWSVENSVDNLIRNNVDLHADNPGEELNYHGLVDKADDKDRGRNFGFPYCFTVWGTKNITDLGNLNVGDQVPDGLGPKDITDGVCNSQYAAPVLALQPHSAPLDIKFTKDGSTAYISFHGSFNSPNPVGYRIASISFKDGKPTAAHSSTDAAKDVIAAADLSKCTKPANCLRPVGLALDAKGRLWFSSDSGEIFVMQKDPNASDDKGSTGTMLHPGWVTASLAVILASFILV